MIICNKLRNSEIYMKFVDFGIVSNNFHTILANYIQHLVFTLKNVMG